MLSRTGNPICSAISNLSATRASGPPNEGKCFDCFKEDAIANLGVSDWHGREAIRENLRAFVDKGFTAHHEVVEYWDGGSLKVFRGFVTMKPNDPTQKIVRPAMTHFFYMDEKDPSKVAHWYGSVGPVAF
jgi:hypothetical protein